MHFATAAMLRATCGYLEESRYVRALVPKSVKLLASIWLEYARKAVRVWTYVEVMRLYLHILAAWEVERYYYQVFSCFRRTFTT